MYVYENLLLQGGSSLQHGGIEGSRHDVSLLGRRRVCVQYAAP